MNNILKIALSGQVDRDTRIIYTYPEAYDPMHADASNVWLRAIFDPRDARYFDAAKVYACWSTRAGNYYGMIIPSPSDTRNGRLMITIFAGQNIIRNGAALLRVFDALERILVRENYALADKAVIGELLSTLVLIPAGRITPSSPAGSIGFRTFAGPMQLEQQLSNCDQRTYPQYRRVLFVPITAMPSTANPAFHEITDPLTVKYYFRQPLPMGMSVDIPSLTSGGTVTISIEKPGFTTQKVRVAVDGTPNNYFDYEGSELVMRQESASIGRFKRSVTLDVVDSWKRPIHNVSIAPNGNRLSVTDHTVEFENEAPDYDITVSDKMSGRSAHVHISADDLKRGMKTVVIPGGTPPSKQEINAGTPAGAPQSSPLRIGAIALGSVVGLYLLYAAVCGMASGAAWPFHRSETQEATVKTDSVSRTTPPADTTLAADESQKELADAVYMKGNDTWMFSQISSAKYNQLISALSNGDVATVTSQQWFDQSNLNGYWRQIIDCLNSLPADRKDVAAEKMRTLTQNSSLSLGSLLTALQSLDAPTRVDTPAPAPRREQPRHDPPRQREIKADAKKSKPEASKNKPEASKNKPEAKKSNAALAL